MKKIIVILVLCLLFACSIFIKPKEFSLQDYFDSGLLHIYTNRPINETSIAITNIYMSTSNKGIKKGDIVGESLYFKNLEIDSAITKLKAKIKFTEYLEEQHLTLIYAYTNLISKYEIVNNVKINLQISTCDEYSVIGWPLIYGSF
ncbi:MAG: YwmB family TATA-box binding protein [Clostridia bacterium]|nr:YwmB family TATA-box binding protein [Clostridia bacterium]